MDPIIHYRECYEWHHTCAMEYIEQLHAGIRRAIDAMHSEDYSVDEVRGILESAAWRMRDE